MAEVTIELVEAAGSEICVSSTDGAKVHEAIKSEFQRKNRVTVSFSGVTELTTAFLNAAIGQLYGKYSEEEIHTYLAPPVNIEPWQINLLKLSIDRAKSYFKDPQAARSAFTAVTGIEDDEDN